VSRVILDTNTHVSCAISRSQGVLQDALSQAYKYHDIYQSPETLTELREVLMREKFDRFISRQARLEFLDEVTYLSEIVKVDPQFHAKVSPDPKDDMFFALADAVDAHFIVSGDKKDVLSIPRYKGTWTISPDLFVGNQHPSLAFARNSGFQKPHHGILVPDVLNIS
jgi:uncharacterized protein